MRLWALQVSFVAFLGMLFCSCALAPNEGNQSSVEALLDQLQVPQTSQRATGELIKLGKSDPAVAKFLAARIPDLIRRYRLGEPQMQVWGNEVRVAGELKMIQAIPILVERIECFSTALNINAFGFETRPAVAALISIGTPSIPAVAGLLAHGNNIQRAEAAYVLGEVNTPNARQALKAALPKETDPDVRMYIEHYLNPPPAPWAPPKPARDSTVPWANP